MLPERRSLESGYEVCHKLGGSISNPLDETENDLLLGLGNQFYNVCEAGSQSGKTLWIGIERDSANKWAVRDSYSNDLGPFHKFFTLSCAINYTSYIH